MSLNLPDPHPLTPLSLVRNPFARILLLVVGWIAIGLAIAAAILPAVPMWPFLLGAAFCFERSSVRFHDWLITHRWLGPHVRQWKTNRGMTRRSKWTIILTSLIVSGIYVIFLEGLWGVKIVSLSLSLALCLFILSRPTVGESTQA